MEFLINTLTHWDEPPRARHQVANALSKLHKVVFVAANKPGLPRIEMQDIHDNLTVITPYFPVDHRIRYRISIINELYQNWLFQKLKKHYQHYTVINFDFTATKINNFFSQVIYYCNDNFSSISKHINPYFIARYHQRCESKVAMTARFCVAISEILKSNLLRYNPNTFEIPLGSPDIDEFKIAVNFKPMKVPQIKVGFVGFIKSLNLSNNILNKILEDKNIILTLIGPIEDDFLNHIKERSRLIIKGPLTGKTLYEEINKFDVTIAPYSNRLMKDVYAGTGTGSKIYHYFSLGKPVVISYMAGLKDMKLTEGMIYIAENEENFLPLIYKAFEENSEDLIKLRIQYARENTWEKRMDKLIDLFQRFF